MFFKQDNAMSTLNAKLLEFLDWLISLNGSISSTESDVNICIEKAPTAFELLSI